MLSTLFHAHLPKNRCLSAPPLESTLPPTLFHPNLSGILENNVFPRKGKNAFPDPRSWGNDVARGRIENADSGNTIPRIGRSPTFLQLSRSCSSLKFKRHNEDQTWEELDTQSTYSFSTQGQPNLLSTITTGSVDRPEPSGKMEPHTGLPSTAMRLWKYFLRFN
jgi:hypothetical protein